MQLVIGANSFDVNAVWFSPVQRLVTGQTGGYAYIDHNWVIHEVIQASSGDPMESAQADLTAAIAAREAAIRNISGDVVFRNETTGADTAHRITYANTINGIKGSVIEYPGGLGTFGGRIWGSGSEYVDAPDTFRYLVTQIRARELAVEYETVFYAQSYRYNAGGTQFVVQRAFQGIPRRFNICQTVPSWAVQKGIVVGATNYPALPAAIGGTFSLDPERSWVDPGTPQILGLQNQSFFPLRFEYHYRAALPIPGTPPAVV